MPQKARPKKRGRKPFQPTAAQRKAVAVWASIGTPHDVMAAQLGIARQTLENAFDRELKDGKAITDQAISKSLYQKALTGNVPCMIFWAKTRLGWRETNRTEVTGADGGPLAVQNLSDAELRAQLQAVLDAAPPEDK